MAAKRKATAKKPSSKKASSKRKRGSTVRLYLVPAAAGKAYAFKLSDSRHPVAGAGIGCRTWDEVKGHLRNHFADASELEIVPAFDAKGPYWKVIERR